MTERPGQKPAGKARARATGRLLVFAAAMALSGPALAEPECYFSERGDHMFIEGNRFVVTFEKSWVRRCSTGAGENVRFAMCDNNPNPIRYYPAASRQGGELDVLVFANTLWYPCDWSYPSDLERKPRP